jgi:hypothetical protein
LCLITILRPLRMAPSRGSDVTKAFFIYVQLVVTD